MAHSTSVYHVSGGMGTNPRSFKSNSGYIQQMTESGFRSNNHSTNSTSDPYRRNRSNSSGCFLERLDLETPTPPPQNPIFHHLWLELINKATIDR